MGRPTSLAVARALTISPASVSGPCTVSDSSLSLLVFTVLVLALSANAQSPVDKHSESETTLVKKVDPKLNVDAVRLDEVSVAKKHLPDNHGNSINDAVTARMDTCHGIA